MDRLVDTDWQVLVILWYQYQQNAYTGLGRPVWWNRKERCVRDYYNTTLKLSSSLMLMTDSQTHKYLNSRFFNYQTSFACEGVEVLAIVDPVISLSNSAQTSFFFAVLNFASSLLRVVLSTRYSSAPYIWRDNRLSDRERDSLLSADTCLNLSWPDYSLPPIWRIPSNDILQVLELGLHILFDQPYLRISVFEYDSQSCLSDTFNGACIVVIC
jgi:hypothetical protein